AVHVEVAVVDNHFAATGVSPTQHHAAGAFLDQRREAGAADGAAEGGVGVVPASGERGKGEADGTAAGERANRLARGVEEVKGNQAGGVDSDIGGIGDLVRAGKVNSIGIGSGEIIADNERAGD